MKRVLQEILKRKKRYAQLPFFDFLRDSRLTARQRISFYPGMAHFIMAFGDLNSLILRREAHGDPWQEMVNAHTHEDDRHWAWYLEDYQKLGFDRSLTTSQQLKNQFSKNTVANRQLMYGLVALTQSCDSVGRLAIIEAIEETGQVLFSLILPIALELEKDTQQELRYCGLHHFQLETGHSMNGDHLKLSQIELDDTQFAQAQTNVKTVFELFTAWTDELLIFARRQTWQAAHIGAV
jgi:hypothetical protein